MIRRTMLGLVASSLLASIATAQTMQTAPIASDTQFLDKAIAANRFEVETGRLAQLKSKDPKLKEFAGTMVTDHGKALAELEEISKGLNRPMPAELDKPHQVKLEALKSRDGAAFDTAYKAEMKQGHAETLSLLQSHRKVAVDEKVKAWIDKTLPVVQAHKAMIDKM